MLLLLIVNRYAAIQYFPIQKMLSIGQFLSDPISDFFFINVEFLYFCVTLLCVKHNLLDNFILMKNNMKLKLQAAMEGTSHPAHRQPVASERQGTVSNMYLKLQI